MSSAPVAGALAWVFGGRTAQAQSRYVPVFEQRLVNGLRVKTKADEEFIERVVQLVRERRLPIKLVDATYFWAIRRARANRYTANNPMVYFRPAMVARAKAVGIAL